jgi:cell division protein FtsB
MHLHHPAAVFVLQATNADHLLHRVRELEADVAELQEALSTAQTTTAEKDQQLA